MADIMSGNPLSKFYQSFSGTDTIAFLMMPGCTPIVLGSLTTISYSMFRNKKPVINIGRTNINGVTRGSRIFAGTMVFTLINQHWVRELQTQWSEESNYGNAYLSGINELKVDELPLFDIMIVSANEYGSAVVMYIFGIDFTDEAQTISVEDLFTENTFSFIARDISTFKKFSTYADGSVISSASSGAYASIKHGDPMRTFMFDDDYLDWNAVSKKAKEYAVIQYELKQQQDRKYEDDLPRELYWKGSAHPFIGGDVLLVQSSLMQRNLYNGDLDGIYSQDVANAVKLFQSSIGYDPSGRVDKRTFIALKHNLNGEGYKIALGINKNGTNIYSNPYLSSTISGILNYGESIEYSDIKKSTEGGVERYFLRTSRGYIYVNDIYSYDFDNGVVQFPTLKKGANNNSAYVILVQNALQTIYNDFVSFRYGVYDDETVKFVTRFQNDYGNAYGLQYVDGTVNPDTWIAIEDVSGGNFGEVSEKHFSVDLNKLPGEYSVHTSNIMYELKDFYASFKATAKILTKVSIVSHYPSGKTKTTATTLEAVDGTKVSLFDYKEALYYDVDEGSMPDKAEFLIYPYNAEPYKWILNFVA